MPGPVYQTPTAPPGWDETRMHLIRIVDPLGGAIAWFAPDLGAACAGYAVRHGEDWEQVFASDGPEALRRQPNAYGCSVIAAVGREEQQPPPAILPWRFIERDPISVTLDATPVLDLGCRDASQSPQFRLTASLQDTALTITLGAVNRGPEAILVDLGFHLSLSPRLLDRPVTVRTVDRRAEWPDGDPSPLALGPATTAIRLSPHSGGDQVFVLEGEMPDKRVLIKTNDGVRSLDVSVSDQEPRVSVALVEGAGTGEPVPIPGRSTLRVAATIALERGHLD